MVEQRVANAPTRGSIPPIRSISGLYRIGDGLHITVHSTRKHTLITPHKVLLDYDEGKVGLGWWDFSPDPMEQCHIEIKKSET